MRIRVAIILSVALLSACTDRSYTPITPEALAVGSPATIFAATTRVQKDDGSFGPDRADNLSLLELTVSIPPDRRPGRLDFGYGRANPEKQFILAGQTVFDQPEAFRARLKQELARQPAGQRELTLFVHGFNSTQTETAYRAAQLAHDIEMPGSLMVYSWPSKGHALGYAYDADSTVFARDGLETVLRRLGEQRIDRLAVVAHSMGSFLLMEALRQIEIATPGWSARHLDGVILISPDLDLDVFRSQMRRIKTVPQPFVVMASEKDNVLNLSRHLRGKQSSERLGQIGSAALITDLPVAVIDTSQFSDEAESGHFIAATSPTLLAMIAEARNMTDLFEAGNVPLERAFPGIVSYARDTLDVVIENNDR
ncbi:alpha/beta fold hydrolase [Ruegeria pomeroyi]|jgi:esterase/lipase superfamily enzyme|uniref:Lipoprotein, putative n=2 Tax=Ruegeria pomeroyi TaxID=89184 RepID=Q5LLN9_RUEPO|nr:alpha/beta fold hydrolase [Ruegeria pomeroyi]HCE72512.1 alpha/beta hydrolase [Ruegeria sp.]AAV97097.1 lipoprotein, putative [Ruegeria pomeroyi DSS-3]NVK96039.1 alpha/beta fold hydrolase [Ruegeria pomeroyi]NVK99909.1 alpha/beta fold hydrolase [Ruegeria pomeroyi]QWV10620.1 alpha/beta fold hydrolase [Ruegeria pomeroyi]